MVRFNSKATVISSTKRLCCRFPHRSSILLCISPVDVEMNLAPPCVCKSSCSCSPHARSGYQNRPRHPCRPSTRPANTGSSLHKPPCRTDQSLYSHFALVPGACIGNLHRRAGCTALHPDPALSGTTARSWERKLLHGCQHILAYKTQQHKASPNSLPCPPFENPGSLGCARWEARPNWTMATSTASINAFHGRISLASGSCERSWKMSYSSHHCLLRPQFVHAHERALLLTHMSGPLSASVSISP